jgi:N-acetylglucosaminyl-diphospho-decaprenol L-rhamnosyltransferase
MARGADIDTIGVVIPVYRAGSALLDAIASLMCGDLVPTWIIVVDNASRDDAVDRALATFPSLEAIRNGENIGFGRACNEGIERLQERGAEFVFLMNQDVTVDAGTLGSLHSLARSCPRAAAIGPKTVSSIAGDGEGPTLLYNGAWRTTLPLWQRIPSVAWVESSVAIQPVPVDFVWGHAMLLRVAALDEVGLFDPAFFMYYEDLDLCDRLRAAGWEAWCDRRAIARHAIADASRAIGSEQRRWRWKQTSGRYYCRKQRSRPLGDLLWLASTGRMLANLCRRGQWDAARHLIRATLP